VRTKNLHFKKKYDSKQHNVIFEKSLHSKTKSETKNQIIES